MNTIKLKPENTERIDMTNFSVLRENTLTFFFSSEEVEATSMAMEYIQRRKGSSLLNARLVLSQGRTCWMIGRLLTRGRSEFFIIVVSINNLQVSQMDLFDEFSDRC